MRIGVRELRQDATRYLRQVAAGEVIEITNHGEPIARLMPITTEPEWTKLIEQGEVRPAKRPHQDLLGLTP
jgi:prevent-host-death family protein